MMVEYEASLRKISRLAVLIKKSFLQEKKKRFSELSVAMHSIMKWDSLSYPNQIKETFKMKDEH